ncbi:BAR domain-containing protein [Neorhodopirellula lusitana]|uniref:hypothetical protein n=1 Tax=Neorhodopirellula lusitana TaxID=445327 RepID=UPI00384D9F65
MYSDPQAASPRSVGLWGQLAIFALVLMVSVLCPIVGAQKSIADQLADDGSISDGRSTIAGQSSVESSPVASSVAEPSPDEIAELIEGLASDSYATRIRCRNRLARVGLAAFDQLREARNHPDSEVAIVARRLTSGLGVRWSTEADSDAVIKLLNEYGARSIDERKRRVAQLAALPRSESFAALLRLAKFEPEPTLGRLAALAMMNQDVKSSQAGLSSIATQRLGEPEDEQELLRRRAESQSIVTQLSGRMTVTNRWLLQYAEDLRDGGVDVARWQEIFDQHRNGTLVEDGATDVMGGTLATQGTLFSRLPQSASQLLQLIWITAERAIASGERDAALDMVIQNVDLIPSRTRDLIQTSSWALDRSLYPAVTAMLNRHLEIFGKSPILLYSAAEAYSRLGDQDEAGRLAGVALAINPLPIPEAADADGKPGKDGAKPKPIHPQTIQVHAEAHVRIAMQLTQRGLFRWAEEEYSLVMQRLPLDNAISAFARSESARMFGELEDHAAVIRTLTPLAKRIDQDDEFKDRLIASNFTAPVVKSDLAFHQGMLLAEQGKSDEARQKLEEAFQTNHKNIDILIAMYRLDGDQKWKDSVQETLSHHVQLAEQEVAEIKSSFRRVGPLRSSPDQLAKRLNAYAWLVGNTTGDYAKALRYSIESLRLTPNQPELMDTCARCYFAVGDFQSAVEMQADACQRMPHSPPLKRQLEEFQAALQQSREKS